MKHFRISGCTSANLRQLDKVDQIGEIRCVRGYIRTDSQYVRRTSVMVHGTAGTVRFDGFSWGYDGEGPRGLDRLFSKLNIPQYQRNFVQSHDWSGWEGPDREFWRVNLHPVSKALGQVA